MSGGRLKSVQRKAGRIFRSKPAIAAGLAAGFIVSAWLSLAILHYNTKAPSDWMATSFLICAMVMLDGRLRIATVAVCAVASLALTRLCGWPWPQTLSLAGLTLMESLLGAWLLLRLSRTPRVQSLYQAVRLLFQVMLPTLIASTVVAAGLTQLIYHRGADVIAKQWLAGHGMGMIITLPTLLLLATPLQTRPPRKGWLEKVIWATVIGIFALGNVSAIGTVTFLLVLPLATVLAFRLGPKLTVITMLSLIMLGQIVGYLSPNPNLWGTPMNEDMLILVGQAYAIAVYANGMFSGLAIDYQSRVKRQLEKRTLAARRARAQALKASRAKTEFLATMSHEIRTPLNGVLGFAQLLLQRQDIGGEAREQVELIGSSGQALLTVVNDILDFSKVEAGQVTLDPRAVSLAGVCREACAIVGAEASRKQLALDFTCDHEGEVAHLVDDARLRQVLINLLNNAIKFTSQGGVALRLSIKPEGVRFEVSDTGVGIAAEALPRLFQRFSQADGSISRSHGGTGLGLAISKGLIELMGGQIGVDSKEGAGSTFWIEIDPPIAEGANDDEVAEDLDAGALAAHVLLVDDHPVNRRLGVTVLEMLGCTADIAENGQEAIDAMSSDKVYDLILMDVHMPVMDGLEATRQIRALAGPAAAVPIITMSADVLPEQVAACEAAGMNDCVPKPLRIDDLHACLLHWTGENAPGRAGVKRAA